MPTSSNATKIELTAEAIETLVLATVVAATDHDESHRKMNHQNVVDARSTISHALRELLTPTLRVIASTPAAEIPDYMPSMAKG